jgi:hypothetical protein
MCIGASRPAASLSQLPSIDYFRMIADTAPLSQSSESEREANALTACGSMVSFRQMSKGKG